MTEFVQIIAKCLGRAILSLQQPLELRSVRWLTELVTSTQKSEKIHCPTLHNTMKASTETADWAQSSLTCCFFLPLSFRYTLQLTFLNLRSSWSKTLFTDTCSCRSRGYQMWNNMNVRHTFTAPTRRTTADSSNETSDLIITEPTAVDSGTFIERYVRLSLTCDYSVLQKIFSHAGNNDHLNHTDTRN